jgi:hypothetical protein
MSPVDNGEGWDVTSPTVSAGDCVEDPRLAALVDFVEPERGLDL